MRRALSSSEERRSLKATKRWFVAQERNFGGCGPTTVLRMTEGLGTVPDMQVNTVSNISSESHSHPNSTRICTVEPVLQCYESHYS